MTTRLYAHNDHMDGGPAEFPGCCHIVDKASANLVGSVCADGQHMPALHIDVPCQLLPSSTDGHHHLYIDKPMSKQTYRKLLEALIEAGIVEANHLKHFDRNGMTALRLPGAKKKKGSPTSGFQGRGEDGSLL